MNASPLRRAPGVKYSSSPAPNITKMSKMMLTNNPKAAALDLNQIDEILGEDNKEEEETPKRI